VLQLELLPGVGVMATLSNGDVARVVAALENSSPQADAWLATQVCSIFDAKPVSALFIGVPIIPRVVPNAFRLRSIQYIICRVSSYSTWQLVLKKLWKEFFSVPALQRSMRAVLHIACSRQLFKVQL
jgi:hypothetical protein